MSSFDAWPPSQNWRGNDERRVTKAPSLTSEGALDVPPINRIRSPHPENLALLLPPVA